MTGKEQDKLNEYYIKKNISITGLILKGKGLKLYILENYVTTIKKLRIWDFLMKQSIII